MARGLQGIGSAFKVFFRVVKKTKFSQAPACHGPGVNLQFNTGQPAGRNVAYVITRQVFGQAGNPGIMPNQECR